MGTGLCSAPSAAGITGRTTAAPGTASAVTGTLAAGNQMTEEEAHRYLQKTSMDNGTSFTETAQMILGMLDS